MQYIEGQSKSFPFAIFGSALLRDGIHSCPPCPLPLSPFHSAPTFVSTFHSVPLQSR